MIPRLYIVVVQSLDLGAGRDQDGWLHLGNEAGSCIVGRSKRKVRRRETEVGINTSCELLLKRCSKSSGSMMIHKKQNNIATGEVIGVRGETRMLRLMDDK